MFDFGIYISILVGIIGTYFTLSFPLRKERNDLDISNTISKKEKQKKRQNINTSLTLVNISFSLLIIIISFLYFFYDIKNFFVTNAFPILKKFVNGICSLFIYILPFKKGIILDGNFKFSYITETILLSIIVICYAYVVINLCYTIWNYIITIITSIIIFIGLIWLNVFLSNILCSLISHYFIIFSLILNIIIYFIIACLLLFLAAFLTESFKIRYEKEHPRTFSENTDGKSADEILLERSLNRELELERQKSADEILLEKSLERELKKQSDLEKYFR